MMDPDSFTVPSLLVHHGECPDGEASKFLSKMHWSDRDIKTISWVHKQNPNPNIDAYIGEDVWFVDVTPPAEILQKIRRVAKSVFVLDHHATGLEHAQRVLSPDEYYIDTSGKWSAAGLFWVKVMRKPSKKMPEWLRLINDFDTGPQKLNALNRRRQLVLYDLINTKGFEEAVQIFSKLRWIHCDLPGGTSEWVASFRSCIWTLVLLPPLVWRVHGNVGPFALQVFILLMICLLPQILNRWFWLDLFVGGSIAFRRKKTLATMRNLPERDDDGLRWIQFEISQPDDIEPVCKFYFDQKKKKKEADGTSREEVLIFHRTTEDGERFSLRRAPESKFDLSKLAQKYGGGGHPGAAGIARDKNLHFLPLF